MLIIQNLLYELVIKMDRLISMVDFVLEKVNRKVSVVSHMICIEDYANFLKQKLYLWMFVPCKLVDGVLVVLEEPNFYDKYGTNFEPIQNIEYAIDHREYQEAKERVLFEGIEYVEAKQEGHHSFLRICKSLSTINYPSFWRRNTVEDLIPYNLKLTPTALKQIGL